APFHDVTTLVDLRVEHRWAPDAMTLTEPVGGVVLLLRAGERDATAAQGPAGGGAGVGLVRHDPVRTLPGPAGPVALDADLVQQRQQLRVVPGLPGREDHAHRQPAAVGRKVDLGRQASPRPAERLTGDRELVDPPGRAAPFFRAPAACVNGPRPRHRPQDLPDTGNSHDRPRDLDTNLNALTSRHWG